MEHGDLPLAHARAGMVLSGDLRDAQGRLLLPRATVLNEPQLAALARQGIAALPVHFAPDARLDYLFRKLDPAGADAWAGQALKDSLRRWRGGVQE